MPRSSARLLTGAWVVTCVIATAVLAVGIWACVPGWRHQLVESPRDVLVTAVADTEIGGTCAGGDAGARHLTERVSWADHGHPRTGTFTSCVGPTGRTHRAGATYRMWLYADGTRAPGPRWTLWLVVALIAVVNGTVLGLWSAGRWQRTRARPRHAGP